ncbi:hypothetical protein HELRODRAFT_160642 [Helobdella robusta]|uniref:Uncharacterized protein n=1 Tax=Helobdella robusta TaxID=6412 RepID=T1EQJ5_HELRO|nr:hypothetical protein HELRODRAFT_160642 [Helobdella robusta]ESO06471.1 hypothetical protein HELRODRAFT_160642 [Helobdella robusta]
MANMASACALILSNSSDYQRNIFYYMRSWRTKDAVSTCVLVTVSAISICVMVVCGVYIGREYALSTAYEPTNCRVINVSMIGNEPCNYCNNPKEVNRPSYNQIHPPKNDNVNNVLPNKPACDERNNSDHNRNATNKNIHTVHQQPASTLTSSLSLSSVCSISYYPCYQVMVSYRAHNASHESVALMHLTSLDSLGNHKKCSFYSCHKESEKNKKEIDTSALEYQNMLLPQHDQKHRQHEQQQQQQQLYNERHHQQNIQQQQQQHQQQPHQKHHDSNSYNSNFKQQQHENRSRKTSTETNTCHSINLNAIFLSVIILVVIIFIFIVIFHIVAVFFLIAIALCDLFVVVRATAAAHIPMLLQQGQQR